MSAPIIHVYPGHFPPDFTHPSGAKYSAGLLVAVRGKTVLYTSRVWGGPSAPVPDRIGTEVATPTPAGTYIIKMVKAHTTAKWRWAELPWGARLKETLDKSDVLVEKRSSTPGREEWESVTLYRVTRADILAYHEKLYGFRAIPKTWVFNPFGPIAFRFFKDKNKNGKQDRDEYLAGEMFHTTAEDEARDARGDIVTPGNSHGCLHLVPDDRDNLVGMDILKTGRTLIIHRYDERYGSAP